MGPNVPIEQHGIRDRKAAQKNEFLVFFGFRIWKKSFKEVAFLKKVVFFDASKRSKRLKGEKILPLGCMEATCSDGPFSFLRKVKYK